MVYGNFTLDLDGRMSKMLKWIYLDVHNKKEVIEVASIPTIDYVQPTDDDKHLEYGLINVRTKNLVTFNSKKELIEHMLKSAIYKKQELQKEIDYLSS